MPSLFPLKIAKRCSPFQQNYKHLFLFELFKTIEILFGQWNVLMDILIYFKTLWMILATIINVAQMAFSPYLIFS